MNGAQKSAAWGASCTLTGSPGEAGEEKTCVHKAHMSRLWRTFNQAPGARFPVPITPGLPERYVWFCLGRRVNAVTAPRPAANEAGKGHPSTRPPAMPGNAFGPVFAARRRMLTPGAKQLQRLARTMLVDGEQHISRFPAQAHVRPPPAQRAPPQWLRPLPQKPEGWRRGAADSRQPAQGGAAPRSGLQGARLRL